jgi:lysophospholipase L1-like esterase
MKATNRFSLGIVLITGLVLSACGGGGGGGDQDNTKFAQTWGTASAFAPPPAASGPVPYFPAVAAQSTGIVAPGVAVTPTITPPAGTTNTAVSFANTTVRQIFRVSVGGPQIRLRLSNSFGTSPVTVDELRVALADRAACPAPKPATPPAQQPFGPTCSNIVQATDQPVTVNGSKTFTIPAGQDVYTDPATISVPALGYVAVSFYMKNLTPSLNTHNLGVDTTYVVVGLPGTDANFTSKGVFDAATLGGTAALATQKNVVLVSAIDIVVPDKTRVIIGFGDSITDGDHVLADTSGRWTDDLAARFADASTKQGRPAVAVSNAGIAANRVATDFPIPAGGIAGIKRFDLDALSRSGVTDVIVLLGINDLGANPPTSSDTVIAGYRNLISQAHAKNIKIYFATMTPIRTDVGNDTGTYGAFTASTFPLEEPIRQSLNAWILSSKEHDGAIDFNAAVSAPGRLNLMLAQYNIALDRGNYDQIHSNNFGEAQLANAIDLSWFY